MAIGAASAQTTGATFGTVIRLGGTPSDVVLDESRGRLYLVNANANRVDVYSYLQNQMLGSIGVGRQPLAAAMSMDNAWLYVTNNATSTLTVIDLSIGIGTISQTVSLPAKPEGVEVGADGRALIATQGSGTSNLNNTLLIFDRTQQSGQQVQPVLFPPPPTTPQSITPTTSRPVTIFRGKLIRTPDGKFIVGVSNINNNAQTILYVFETVSGTLLRSRTVTGQSTTLSMSPDGSRIMAGFTMYDIATLAVIGQQNTANAPFPVTGTFNTLQNVGGSAFSSDGTTLYSAFNVAPFSVPATRPQASTLFLSDPTNLSIRLGIKIPESIVAKMVTTVDGSKAWGLSESGLIALPLGTLYNQPILVPETTAVFLAQDPCNNGVPSASLRIANIGGGKLTLSLPATPSSLIAEASTGVAPATIRFTMDPGRAGVLRDPGTNLYSGGGSATNNGTGVNFNIASNEAINIPNTIRVYMNYRQADQRGVIYPVATVPNSNTEGLQDLALDEAHGRLYISNSGFNRVEVFDINARRFLAPIPVGQLPHRIVMGLDGQTLYTANTGSESISIVDLNAGAVSGQVPFPPIPRAGNANVVSPSAMAMGLSGLQFLLNNGTQWSVIGGQAVPRAASPVINGSGNTSTVQTAVTAPQQMVESTDGTGAILLGGNGLGFYYDAIADNYTASAQLFTAPITGYYGPLGAGPLGSYFLANAAVLNGSLSVSNSVQTATRNVAAVAPVDNARFVRLTTAARTTLTAATRDDRRTTLELVDLSAGSVSLVGATAENPIFEVFGTARQAMPPHQMVVDSQGNVYAITISGLSIIPLTPSSDASRPLIAANRPVINSNDGTTNFAPGSFVSVLGSNLAAVATGSTLPPPTVLGGSCVLFDGVALPLLQTSDGIMSAQLPAATHAGPNVVEVRSLATGQASDPVVVTVQKP